MRLEKSLGKLKRDKKNLPKFVVGYVSNSCFLSCQQASVIETTQWIKIGAFVFIEEKAF